MPSPPRVIVIVGPTGSGKSRLAVELARALGGDVINADALQFHDSLPICTARVREDEMEGVRHHLVGCVKYGEYFDVRAFRARAGSIVRECVGEGRSVIVVGGSNYYAQALVSDSLMDVRDREEEECISDKSFIDDIGPNGGRRTAAEDGTVGVDASTAYARLAEVDPESAQRLHPNDIRRVRRYLEIFDTTGERPSDVFKRERTMKKFVSQFDVLGCRTIFIALKCDSKVLDEILRARVLSMVENGLVDELEQFARCHGVESPDGARGDVRQAIGYAEWMPYLQAKVKMDSTPCVDSELASMRDEAIEATVRHTCRLSRRQQSRLTTFAKQYGWPVRFVDVSDSLSKFCSERAAFKDSWYVNVVHRALELCEHEDVVELDSGNSSKQVAVHTCEACGKTLRGEIEWRAHLNGRRHRKASANARKRQRLEFGTKHPRLGRQ